VSQWYCVYTQPRLELWARSNLWERGFEVYLPQFLKRRRHARRTDYVPRPLFPRYLFVRADLSERGQRAVCMAKGVIDILRCGTGNAPTPVKNVIVEEIRSRESEDGFVGLDEIGRLKKGDRVRIVDGALSDHVGLFENTDDDQRVFVLLDLLGRSVRTRIPSDSIARES
tara:strand:- start:133 stop:642 length:510 start_codon:yes stop_codon:yes gene_type:complete